jgi:hypothetical protein
MFGRCPKKNFWSCRNIQLSPRDPSIRVLISHSLLLVSPSSIASIFQTMSDNKACCVTCGYQCRSCYPTFVSHDDDSDVVSRDIEKLEDIIHHFRTVRSQRLRQLNTISSSTRNIPNQILLHIFRSVCSSAPTTKPRQTPHGCPQITLGAVSSHWREVVQNAPELWKTLSVKIFRQNLQNTLSLLQTCLDNNRASFDAVHLMFASDAQYWSDQNFLRSLKDILLLGEGAPTIHTIDLQLPPPGWLSVILDCANINTLTVVAPDIPSLLPWSLSSLTSIHLKHVPVNICFDVLLECPVLRRFSCTEPSRAGSDCIRPNQRHSRVKVFSHLEYLSWHPANQHIWNDNLLERYHFPALHCLAWTLLPGRCNWQSFYQLIISLEPHLQRLELSTSPALVKFPRWFEARWLDLPSIEGLTFVDCPLSLLSIILRKASDLPSLLCLEWLRLNRRYDSEDENSTIAQFHQFLSAKKNNGASCFRLELVGLSLSWKEVNREKIAQLMDDGAFRVEVVNDGVIMDLRDS